MTTFYSDSNKHSLASAYLYVLTAEAKEEALSFLLTEIQEEYGALNKWRKHDG